MDIYYFNITALRNKNVFAQKLKEVDEKRAEKIGRIKVENSKMRSLGAGLLIKFIKEKYKVKGNVMIDKFGKPYFSHSKVHFNISHSGNYVIAAVSKYRIGIDIQKIKNEKHRIAEKNFLPSECEYINRIPNEEIVQQRFCEIWTMKEAYLKNVGIGLRKPLNSFEVSAYMGEPRVIGKPQYKFIQMKLDEKYIIAVCADKKDETLNMEELTI